MANEARISEAYGENNAGRVIRHDIQDVFTVPRGTLMQRTDPRTCSFALAWTDGSVTTSGAFAGILAREKTAADGMDASLITDCIADLKCSGAVVCNSLVYCAGNNEIRNLPAAMNSVASSVLGIGLLNSMSVGTALETGSDGEIIEVRINK